MERRSAARRKVENGQNNGHVAWKCKNQENKQWKNEELKKLVGTCQGSKKVILQKWQKTYKGCDGFHPDVPLDLAKETRKEVVEFLEKVEQSGKWPQQACTSMFFLIPKNVTSERPILFVVTMIRWWEAPRALEVAKWQIKYRVEWDATDGRNGGAQQTVWEILVEMESLKFQAGEKDQGAVALVLDLARILSESASLWSGLGRRTSIFEGRYCGCHAGGSSIRGE